MVGYAILKAKEVNNVDSLKQLNLAMHYIEKHLLDDIDLGTLSRIACCSEYHFRRIFSFLSGMSLGEYVRKRRLALAAETLASGGTKVIDMAVALGYDSADAFSRAFQAMHGVPPSKVRGKSIAVKAFPPLTFQLKISGGIEMDYRIVEKGAFNIVGIKKRIKLVYEGVNPQMDSMWAQLTPEIIRHLKGLSNVQPEGILCVSANFAEGRAEGTFLDQYIGVATTAAEAETEGFAVLPVPGYTWVVFTAVGEFPKALQNLWARIYAEWFPSSGYEMTGGPEILSNEGPDTSKPDFKSEIWIPVQAQRKP